MNARLLRYSPFQLRDFLQQRLALALILLAFTAGLPTYLMTKNTTPGFMQSAAGIMLARQMFANSVTLFLPLGAFLGGVGIISFDRHQGYFRFLFSKPVNVLAYYAQTYAVHAVVFVAAFGLIVWGFSAYTIHFSVHRSMEAAALTFVLIGGLGLLLGSLTRIDGALLILLYVLSLVLQQLTFAPRGVPNGSPAWLARVAGVLPPVLKLDHVRDALYAGQAVDTWPLVHLLAYGGCAAIAGFVLLRRLPLAR